MRYFSLIWMLTLIWQVSIPCQFKAIKDNSPIFEQSFVCPTSGENSHHCCSSTNDLSDTANHCPDSSSDHGPCSSGCGCVCCTLVVMPVPPVGKIFHRPELPRQEVFLSQDLYDFDFHSSVWDPPRL